MRNENRISFILPIFNTPEAYLETSLNSLADFIEPFYEFILIDDGSSDNRVAEICKRFQTKDARFRYFYQENQGVSAARNTGIRQAKGEWLFFLDPDDCLLPKSENSFLEMVDNPSDMLLFGFETIKNAGRVVKQFPINQLVAVSEQAQPNPQKMMLATLRIAENQGQYSGYFLGFPWGKLIRKSFLDKYHLWFPEEINKREDAWFMLHLLSKQPVVACGREVVYQYRLDSSGSLSKKYDEKLPRVFTELLVEVKDLRGGFQDRQAFDEAYALYCFDLTKELVNLTFCNVNNPADYLNRKEAFLHFREMANFSYAFNKVPKFKGALWKKQLFFLISRKNFYGLNIIYLARKMQQRLRGNHHGS